jgi:DNA-binding ferritin-like protein (Dps family)
MLDFINKLMGDKKEYKEQMERVAALPEDYRFVYEKIQNYMWSFVGGSGMDMLKTQYELIDLFEESVAENMQVLDVTGEDVAGFCDELIRGNKLWIDSQRKKLNLGIKNKFEKGVIFDKGKNEKG